MTYEMICVFYFANHNRNNTTINDNSDLLRGKTAYIRESPKCIMKSLIIITMSDKVFKEYNDFLEE